MERSLIDFIELIEATVKGGIKYIEKGESLEGNNQINEIVLREAKVLFPLYTEDQIETLYIHSILTTGQPIQNSPSPVLSIYYQDQTPAISYSDIYTAYAILTLTPKIIGGGFAIYNIAILTQAVREYLTNQGWLVGVSRMAELKPINGSSSNARDSGLVFDLKYET